MIKQQQQVFLEENMSNLTSAVSGEASVSSGNNNIIINTNNTNTTTNNNKRGEPSNSIYPPPQQHYFPHQSEDEPQLPAPKKKRNLPGNPDPEAEVIALTPKSLLATNRFVCEICNKGFQRDQNLQLHRRGHNLPWKLKQRTNKEVRKKVYVCPEPSCVHHDPSRALGDLTGIKKHFCRKHGEKKYKCEKCSKRYAVQSDWKAHSKVCGTREYRCDCGTLFSRRDSFITHRAFCDALAEETARSITTTNPLLANPIAAVGPSNSHFLNLQQQQLMNHQQQDPLHAFPMKREPQHHQSSLISLPPWLACPPMDHTSSSSATAMFHHQDQMMQHHQQQEQQQSHQNPSNPNMGPTFGGAYHSTQAAATHHPHMSATALLQKAAQMGATMSNTAPHQQPHLQHFQQQHQSHVSDTNSNTPTTASATPPTTTTAGLFGLNLSSRDHHHLQQQQQQHQEIMPTNLSSFEMNKAANTTTTTSATTITTTTNPPTTGPSPSPNPNPTQGPSLQPSSSSYFHDMMVNSLSSTYDHHGDDAFGIGSMVKKDPSSLSTFHNGNNNTNGGGNDGLTRDFLGLRPLSHNDILTIAGLGNCMTTNNNNSHHHQQQQQQQDSHKSWQGN